MCTCITMSNTGYQVKTRKAFEFYKNLRPLLVFLGKVTQYQKVAAREQHQRNLRTCNEQKNIDLSLKNQLW